MKKIAAFIVTIFLVSLLLGIPGYAIEQSQEKAISGDSIFIDKLPDIRNNTPETIKAYLKDNAEKIGLPVNGSYKYTHMTEDEFGIKHLRYQQEYQGIPIFGKQIIVGTKGKDVLSIQGMVSSDKELKNAKLISKISKEKAIDIAKDYIGIIPESIKIKVNGTEKQINGSVEASMVWLEKDQNHILTYCVDIAYLKPKTVNKKVFIDANTGEVVHEIDEIMKDNTYIGTGKGVLNDTKSLKLYYANNKYYLRDVTHGDLSGYTNSILTYDFSTLDAEGYFYLMSDNNGKLCETSTEFYKQRAGVDAHFYFDVVYNYYSDTFDRNSFDDAGTNVLSVVHFTDDGTPWENAAWTGNELGLFLFGDGDNFPGQQSYTREFSAGLDVVGHEFTHAVIDNNGSGGLIYEYQSGAINESIADLFGQIIERKIKGDNDWIVGEDLCIGSYDDMKRSMSSPGTYGQPSKMSEYVYTSADNGGVHINSGIPNKAAYLIASQLGDEKTAEIYYYALMHKLAPSADFLALRRALTDSARILYPGTNAATIISNAFDVVGVTEPLVFEGYSISDMVPLTDGKVLIGDTLQSVVQILNTITEEIEESFDLAESTDSIAYDYDNNKAYATQKISNKIASIDINTGEVEYINVSAEPKKVIIGEDNYIFALCEGQISVIDTSQNQEIYVRPVTSDVEFLAYDKLNNAVYAGETGVLPSQLYRYNFNLSTRQLEHNIGDVWQCGGFGTSLTISPDSRHLAFTCSGGNGSGYTVYDYDISNMPSRFGEWVVGAYPEYAAFSNDSKYIAISNGSEVKLFDTNTHALIKVLGTDGYDGLTNVCFSKDDEYIYWLYENMYGEGLNIYRVKNPVVKPVSITSLEANPASPQAVGTAITFTAKASGGTELQYRYRINDGTTWTYLTDFTPNNQYVWTPTAPGNYIMRVYVKDVETGNTEYTWMNYTITEPVQPIVINSFTASPASPAPAGTTITFTVQATGGTQLQYRYRLYDETTSTYLTSYISSNQYVWTPTAPGNYQMRVYVRDVSTGIYKYKSLDYTVTEAAQPITINSLTASPASPQPVNTAITFTTDATGGTQLQYRYRLHNGTAWVYLTDFIPNNQYVWTPTAPGNYIMRVYVKDVFTGNTEYTWINYTVTEAAQPITINSLTASPESPAPVGTPITFTVQATGGTQLQYRYRLHNGTAWVYLTDFIPDNQYVWTPTAPGNYIMRVYVKDVGTGNTEYTWMNYTVTEGGVQPITINGLTASPASPQPAGTPITFTTDATGGTELQYRYRLNNGTAWVYLTDFIPDNQYVWTPTAPGNYIMRVYVKDVGTGNTEYTWMNYTVTEGGVQPITINGLTANPASPAPVGTPITFTTDATGGTELQYRYRLNNGTAWVYLTDFIPDNQYVWTPAAPGNYIMRVYVKDVGTGTTEYTWVNYTVTGSIQEAFTNEIESYSETFEPEDTETTSDITEEAEPVEVKITSVSTEETDPYGIGTPIRWTCEATGGKELLYQFKVYDGSEWVYETEYTTDNTFEWTPEKAGEYTLYVYVKDSESNEEYDAYEEISFTVVEAEQPAAEEPAPVIEEGQLEDEPLPESDGTAPENGDAQPDAEETQEEPEDIQEEPEAVEPAVEEMH